MLLSDACAGQGGAVRHAVSVGSKRLPMKKNNAHYGVIATTGAKATVMLTWAQRLVAQAGSVVAG